MNIKFNSKYLKSVLCASVFSAAGVAANKQHEEIKELTDAEFAQKKLEIQKKKSKLNKNNRQIFEALRINKYNIQILNRLMENNSDFYKLYSSLYSIENIHSARFLDYELNNQKEINQTLGKDFIKSNIHESIKSTEELDFKLQILEYGLKTPKAGKNIYFTEIIKTAENIEEAQKMLEHVEKYGILPQTRNSFNNNYGKNKTDTMLDGVADVKNKFNLNLNYLGSYANSYNEPYHILKSQNALFRFDTKTGEIVTVEKENQIYNLKDNFVTSVVPKRIKKDKNAFLDDEKLLSGEIKTSSLDGTLLNQYQFRQSKIEGEFEVEETSQSGKKYKIGLAEVDKKGGKHIEKHFTSPDGIVTDYVFADNKKGNRYLYYKITDKDNNVLYKSEKKFKTLSDHHFQSSNNGVVYDIVIEKDRVKVNKLDGSGASVEYKIKEFSRDDCKNMEKLYSECAQDDNLQKKLKAKEITYGEIAIEKGIIEKFCIDKKLMSTLKNLSGEEWFALKKSAVYTINRSLDKDTAHSIGNGIELGEKNLNLSTLEHEIGHEKADALDLENDEQLKQIYEQEKRAFTTHFPDIAAKQAGYFMRNIMANGFSETMAETNLIINCAQNWEDIGTRTMFLQQNFPKTIAYIAKRYEELC